MSFDYSSFCCFVSIFLAISSHWTAIKLPNSIRNTNKLSYRSINASRDQILSFVLKAATQMGFHKSTGRMASFSHWKLDFTEPVTILSTPCSMLKKWNPVASRALSDLDTVDMVYFAVRVPWGEFYIRRAGSVVRVSSCFSVCMLSSMACEV